MGATGAHESRGGRMSMRSAQDRMSVGRGDEGTTTPTRLELTWTPTRLRAGWETPGQPAAGAVESDLRRNWLRREAPAWPGRRGRPLLSGPDSYLIRC